jgi:hypothetical protein
MQSELLTVSLNKPQLNKTGDYVYNHGLSVKSYDINRRFHMISKTYIITMLMLISNWNSFLSPTKCLVSTVGLLSAMAAHLSHYFEGTDFVYLNN